MAHIKNVQLLVLCHVTHSAPTLCQSILIIVRETQTKILGGNNETVTWSVACLISNLFGKQELILDSAYALHNISSLMPNKSDIRQSTK